MLESKCDWKFALVIPNKTGYEIIDKYPDMKGLEKGYRKWKRFASEKGITEPIPVEFPEGNTDLPYLVLADLIPNEGITINQHNNSYK